MFSKIRPLLLACTALVVFAATQEALAQDARDTSIKVDDTCSAKPKSRADSVRAVLGHLGVGEGSSVADIGAGGGDDTWVFAEMVGKAGTVFSEEIAEDKVKSLEKDAKKKGLSQVRAVLGRDDDPRLPLNSADLAFMRHVYHHIAKPRKMLQGIWRALKPGGYLVVADRQRGTLRDWVPREARAKKHFWIAETTVVREAREEGFAFVECAEQRWHGKDDFVLVFQRPEGSKVPGRDPDPFVSIPAEKGAQMFSPLARPYERPLFVALGDAHKFLPAVLQSSSGPGLEIILEEWATQKDERPPLPAGMTFPSVLTSSGDPGLGPEPIDVVFFLDSYHLLFHSKALLSKLHEKLAPTGCIYVLDREGRKPLPRREASHRKMIRPEIVEREMAEAGFSLWFRGPRPTSDRFLIVFGKVQPEQLSPETDPFVGGPEISQEPGQWLKDNYWRLRGLQTTEGKFAPFARQTEEGAVDVVRESSGEIDAWYLAQEELALSFQKSGAVYLLTGFRLLDGP